MKIAIIGRTQFLYNTAEMLAKSGNSIVLIGTSKASPEYTRKEKDFEMLAKKIGCSYFCSTDLYAHLNQNSEPLIADLAISMNWPGILAKDTIGKFKYGVLNAHPGDLPKYRGNACPNWAILKRESRIGVSVHFMKPDELDSGNIVCKDYINLDDDGDITIVYKKMEDMIPRLFLEAVRKIAENPHYAGEPQSKNKNDILRCYPRKPQDSLIDWQMSAQDILQLIKASCWPFKGAYTYLGDDILHICEANIAEFKTPVCVAPGQTVSIDRLSHKVGIACGNGIVYFRYVTDSNGTKINADEAVTSMRTRLGYCLEDEIYNLRRRITELETYCKIKGDL